MKLFLLEPLQKHYNIVQGFINLLSFDHVKCLVQFVVLLHVRTYFYPLLRININFQILNRIIALIFVGCGIIFFRISFNNKATENLYRVRRFKVHRKFNVGIALSPWTLYRHGFYFLRKFNIILLYYRLSL